MTTRASRLGFRLAVTASLLAGCGGVVDFGSDDSSLGEGGAIEAGPEAGSPEGGMGLPEAGGHDSGVDGKAQPDGPGCTIDLAFYASGAVDPSNACQACEPATSMTGWTVEADGTSCGKGKVCSLGTCEIGCFIDGVYYAAAASNPMNACQACKPAVSTTTWGTATDETVCSGGACCSGACVDEATDPSHCGGCGTTCPAVTDGTPACATRMCSATCNPGYVLSGTSCVIATDCTVTFPDTTSTTGGPDAPGTLGAGGGGLRYQTGDYVEETFSCGNTSISSLTVDFQMSDDTDTYCVVGTLSWNVMVNGTVVGSYSWVGGSGPTTQTVSQSYTFAPIAAVGGSYTVEYIATTTVCPGGSSWNWLPGGSATMD